MAACPPSAAYIYSVMELRWDSEKGKYKNVLPLILGNCKGIQEQALKILIFGLVLNKAPLS